MNIKALLYDFSGYNASLFNIIHNFSHNHTALKLSKFLSDYVGEYMLFPLHLALFIWIVMPHIKKQQVSAIRMVYAKTIFILICSYFIGAVLVEGTKLYFKFPRPYCGVTQVNLNQAFQHVLEFDLHKCFKSFPSGHAWYTSMFVFSTWSILPNLLKPLAALLIVLICISRIMLGMHFPSDVIYGCAIALLVNVLVKALATRLFSIYSKRIKSMISSW